MVLVMGAGGLLVLLNCSVIKLHKLRLDGNVCYEN